MTLPPSSLTSLPPAQNLRSTVTQALRTAVIVGDLVEEEVYSAPVLAAQLGVSATPVREAMMTLARDGLVEPVKNKGFRVTAMTTHDLEQQTQVRQLLEAPAMQAVAGRIPPADLDALRALADEIQTAAQRSDLVEYLSGDLSFHSRLLAHTHNDQLTALCTSLRGRTRLRALRTLAESGQLIHSAREHHQLLDLLASGDGAGAYRLTLQHIGHASRLWATGTEEQPQATALLDLIAPTERPRT